MNKNRSNYLPKKNSHLISIAESATDSIIVANGKGKIILWNKASERIFGHTNEQALGQNLTIIIPEEFRTAHATGMSRFVNSGETKIMGTTIEISAQKRDGSHFPVELSLSSWKELNEVYVCGIIRDISIRKLNETLVKKSLEEKDLLLKEVHHRVKNNLQIIISLLKIYSQNLPEVAIKVFKECQDKIHSMALVHSSIYLSKDLMNVNLSEYTSSFCDYFFDLIDETNVKVIKQLSSATIGMENAVNFGLILSELLSNSYKHAIHKSSVPEIRITLYEENEKIIFEFKDNGPGIPKAILENKNPETYGIEMIKDLVQQMDGECIIQCDKGTNFIITLERSKHTVNKK